MALPWRVVDESQLSEIIAILQRSDRPFAVDDDVDRTLDDVAETRHEYLRWPGHRLMMLRAELTLRITYQDVPSSP